jgi:hypothetical protein
MLYRGRINGIRITTNDLTQLANCESVDIFIGGFWQVYY